VRYVFLFSGYSASLSRYWNVFLGMFNGTNSRDSVRVHWNEQHGSNDARKQGGDNLPAVHRPCLL